MKRYLSSGLVIISLGAAVLAQSPIILQPANGPAAVAQPSAPPKQPEVDVSGAIKSLQEMKAANEEMLNKQQATLQALEELAKQADQLRIYTKRS